MSSKVVEEFKRVIKKGKKYNTYKFTLAKFLLDFSKNSKYIEDTKIDYNLIAKYFFNYYWIEICEKGRKQVSENKNIPVIETIIKDYCGIKNINIDEIIREIAQKCFRDVIPRFQYKNGTLYEHYHQPQSRGYKMPPRDTIKELKNNYEVLFNEVNMELKNYFNSINTTKL
jgi:hypothetical protein